MAGSRTAGPRFAYQLGEDPQRGDIVIFNRRTELDRNKIRLVRRVIGLPRETVDIKDNHVYTNQSEISSEETYLLEGVQSNTYHSEVPDGYYLMLGDSRNHLSDVRFWGDPCVPGEDILAKVLFRYYPGTGRIQ